MPREITPTAFAVRENGSAIEYTEKDCHSKETGGSLLSQGIGSFKGLSDCQLCWRGCVAESRNSNRCLLLRRVGESACQELQGDPCATKNSWNAKKRKPIVQASVAPSFEFPSPAQTALRPLSIGLDSSTSTPGWPCWSAWKDAPRLAPSFQSPSLATPALRPSSRGTRFRKSDLCWESCQHVSMRFTTA